MKQLSDIESRTIAVPVGELDVNVKDWQRFNLEIPAEQRRRFLSNMLGDLIKELLYSNPELFTAYGGVRKKVGLHA